MNGLYVIGFIVIVGIWYLVKIIRYSRIRHVEKNNELITEIKSPSIKWFSIIISLIATAIIKRDIIIAGKLTGSGLAQSDFGIFIDMIIYVMPSILLVVICMFYHIKYLLNKHTKVADIAKEPFVISAIIVILLPMIIMALR